LKRLLIIGDRGYADGKMFTFMKKKGMSFVIRVPCNVEIELPTGEWVALRDLLPEPSDEVIFLEGVRYSKEHGVRLNIVALWKKGYDEPWFIATDLSSPSDAIAYYKKRFLVEETFKSSKTYEGLEHLKARNKDVLRGMIKAIFLACAFLILVGMAIEPFVSTFIPSLTSYESRYSVFTKALLCLERLRGGYAKLLCPKNLRAILHQNLFLGGESM
ncbi:MAG: transposase, partial [candidate division WOR-3 bacterium]